jgi:hypothetical protein
MNTHKLGKQYKRLTARERGLLIVAAPIKDQVCTAMREVRDEFRLGFEKVRLVPPQPDRQLRVFAAL